MAFEDCMRTAVEGEEISQEDADRLVNEFNRARARAAQGGEGIADAEAKRAVQDLLKAETEHQKRKAKLSLSSIQRIAADIDGFRTPAGQRDVAAAATYLLEHHGQAKFSSVTGRHSSILGMAHARMENLLYTFRRSKLLGDVKRMNRAVLANVVREAFGEDSGDIAAKGLYHAWGDTAEWLRQRFNAAGGAIGKLENWGLPQWHDPRALRQAGQQQWIDYIRPLLDTSRMTHPLSGRPVTQGELQDVLASIWDGVVTDGWDRRDPRRQAFGRGALANQRAEHRFLVFKDAESWMRYQQDFGGGSDPFATMMGHINMMSRDIAAMEILGPNPSSTVEWLKQAVMKEGNLKAAGKPSRFGGSGDPLRRVTKYTSLIDNLWASIRGTLSTPVNGLWASIAAGTRDWITASVLGSAVLSSGSDFATSAVTRRFAGISGSVAADYMRAWLPSTQREAVASGLILDNALHVFHQQARYVGTFGGPEWVRWVGDRVLTLSGLTPHTQAARHAFGLAFMHELAKQSNRGFDALEPLFRTKLAQYGFNDIAWDVMRQVPRHQLGSGVPILRPADIAASNERLAERYLEMIQSETEYAVPSGTHRSRLALTAQNRPGTIPGELLRSFAQFKAFGATFAMLHGRRIVDMLASKESRKLGFAYAGALLVSTTIMGALSAQLKSLAAGRDPAPMTEPKFWAAAALQGGGIGIYGDLLFSDVNRYGGGLEGMIAGPLAERVNDFRNLTIGNVVTLGGDTLQELRGEHPDWGKARATMGKQAIRFASGNIPGSNIWYLHMFAQRMVLDQLNYLADPEANRAFKQQQRNWQKNFGQTFWWRPGQALPDRPPALGHAVTAPAG